VGANPEELSLINFIDSKIGIRHCILGSHILLVCQPASSQKLISSLTLTEGILHRLFPVSLGQ